MSFEGYEHGNGLFLYSVWVSSCRAWMVPVKSLVKLIDHQPEYEIRQTSIISRNHSTCWTANVAVGECVTFVVAKFTSWNWWKWPLPLTSNVFGLLFPLAWWCARNLSTPSLWSQSRICTVCSDRSRSYSSLWGSLDGGIRTISAPNTPSALWQPGHKLQNHNF
jgi:hypothetical protein